MRHPSYPDSLKPLSEEQQTQAINTQLLNNPFGKTFSEHLLSFSKVRSEHDRIYYNEAFSVAEDRERIEKFTAPNRQFVNGKGGERDKEMRQKTRDGKFCIVSTESAPASKYLQGLCGVLTGAVLTRIDDAIVQAQALDPETLRPSILCYPFPFSSLL